MATLNSLGESILMPAHTILVTVTMLLSMQTARAADWYVSPDGVTTNAGTRESPWDIASALNGREEVKPGDTIYLLEGTYRRRPNELFDVRLKGSVGRPIHVRPAPGQRARIDGGLAVQSPSAYVWIRDLEIFVSEPLPDKPVSAGSHPEDLKRPWGGLHMHGGTSCKYIDLVIHNCNQGISSWQGEENPEIYGCIIYDNGWLGVDRGHGHCIYTQNQTGAKTISHCIMTCPFDGSYTMHAYGSERAYVDNYLVTDNICYGKGPFLIGGGRPSRAIYVFRNYLYGVDMRIGYDAPYNVSCVVTDNVIVNGRLEITNYRSAIQRANLVLAKGAARPTGAKSVLLPNTYDPDRLYLAVYNWDKADRVEVKTGDLLRDGDTAELFDPRALFGNPAAKAICRDGAIRIAVQGEFAVFVLRISRGSL
jgi:hypothetical protein